MRISVPFDSSVRLEAVAISGLAFLLLPLAALAAGQIWVLAIAAAIVTAFARLKRGTLFRDAPRALSSLLLVLVVWGAASAIWSIAPDRSVATAARLLLVSLGTIVLIQAAVQLDPAERRLCARALVAGSAFGIALIAIEVATSGVISVWLDGNAQLGHELDRLNRTGAVVAMIVWPAALVTARLYGRYQAAAVIVLCAIVLVVVAPRSPLVALAVGAGAFAIGWLSQRWAKRLLLVGFGISVLIVPFLDSLVPTFVDLLVANIQAPNSEVHRLRVWEFASGLILQQPVAGWGLDSSRVVPGGNEMLPLFTDGGVRTVSGPALPLHPHNALIQIWLETGIVGVGIAAGLFALAVKAVPESTRGHAGPAVAIAATATAFTIAQLGFGIWQGWWMATLGAFAVIVAALLSDRPGPAPPRER